MRGSCLEISVSSCSPFYAQPRLLSPSYHSVNFAIFNCFGAYYRTKYSPPCSIARKNAARRAVAMLYRFSKIYAQTIGSSKIFALQCKIKCKCEFSLHRIGRCGIIVLKRVSKCLSKMGQYTMGIAALWFIFFPEQPAKYSQIFHTDTTA